MQLNQYIIHLSKSAPSKRKHRSKLYPSAQPSQNLHFYNDNMKREAFSVHIHKLYAIGEEIEGLVDNLHGSKRHEKRNYPNVKREHFYLTILLLEAKCFP